MRRVERGSHFMPLLMQREHDGSCGCQRESCQGDIDELTALSQRVFAFAQVTHAIALLDGSLW